MVDSMHTLRSELDLTRASQLTLLRLQLALHKSNRRAAMQALDDLLDIDAEMEGLAAALSDITAHPAGDPGHAGIDAALTRFIELQKAAIAAEKHALAGGDLRREARQISISATGDGADDADLRAQPLLPGDEANDDETGGKRRTYVLAAAIIVICLGCGLLAYLWPALPGAVIQYVKP
jgi:hypothetical protein